MSEHEHKREHNSPELPPENQSQPPQLPFLPQSGPEWRVWEVVVVFFVALFMSSLPALFANSNASRLGLSLISYLLQIACFFLLPLINVWVLHGQSPEALGVIRPRAVDCFRIAIPCGILFYLLNVLTAMLVSVIMPEQWLQEQSILLMFDSAGNMFEICLLVLFIGVLAPISEEMLFRAFLLPPLRRRYGRKPAFVIAAAIFAGMHLNIGVFIPLFVGGLCFCWLYDKYGNLILNSIAHCMWNLIALSAYMIIGG